MSEGGHIRQNKEAECFGNFAGFRIQVVQGRFYRDEVKIHAPHSPGAGTKPNRQLRMRHTQLFFHSFHSSSRPVPSPTAKRPIPVPILPMHASSSSSICIKWGLQHDYFGPRVVQVLFQKNLVQVPSSWGTWNCSSVQVPPSQCMN